MDKAGMNLAQRMGQTEPVQLEQSREIPAYIRALSDYVGDLHVQLESFEKRLDPILAQRPACVSSGDPSPFVEPSTQLGSRVYDTINMVRTMLARIEDLQERIQV